MVHYLEPFDETACLEPLPAVGWEHAMTRDVDEVTCPHCITVMACRVEMALSVCRGCGGTGSYAVMYPSRRVVPCRACR